MLNTYVSRIIIEYMRIYDNILISFNCKQFENEIKFWLDLCKEKKFSHIILWEKISENPQKTFKLITEHLAACESVYIYFVLGKLAFNLFYTWSNTKLFLSYVYITKYQQFNVILLCNLNKIMLKAESSSNNLFDSSYKFRLIFIKGCHRTFSYWLTTKTLETVRKNRQIAFGWFSFVQSNFVQFVNSYCFTKYTIALNYLCSDMTLCKLYYHFFKWC